MASRDERKARNIYNESLRRAQAGDTSSYARGEMDRYGISDPSTTPFRGSGAGNLNPALDAGRNILPGIYGAAIEGIKTLGEGVAMANENTRWFKKNAPNAKRYAGVPMNVRESVQTGRDKSFYDKYMNLASLAQDTTQKQYYLDQADTARRNLQITKRINYGLGQLDLDDTPFKGHESYDQGFEGFGPDDLGPRFDIDRFTEAMSEYLPGGEEVTESITEEMPDPFFMERDWELTPDTLEDVTVTDLFPTEYDLEEDAPKVSSYVNLDTVYDFTENFLNTPWGGDYSGPQEYITHLEKESPTAKDKNRDELIELLIKINYLKEK